MNGLQQAYDITEQLNQEVEVHRTRTTPNLRSPSVSGFWFEQDCVREGWSRPAGASIWPSSASPFDRIAIEVSSFGYQREDDGVEVERSIRDLYAHYVIVNESSLVAYLKDHRSLPSLLIEIASNLAMHFGKDTLVKLEVVSTGDEPPIIRVSILWQYTTESGNAALDAFDNQYWLANSQKAAGNVVIDYELV